MNTIIKAQHILITLISFIIAASVPFIVGGSLKDNTPIDIKLMWYCMCFSFGWGISKLSIFINSTTKINHE
jgi:hypothetical protein